MSEGMFYTPEGVRPLYEQIVPVYQAAFAGEPWNEVSKCADQRQRCVGGLSALAVGSLCELCGGRPARPAYEAGELVARFEAVADSRPTSWYVEQKSEGITMAAVAWRATPDVIAGEKYGDVPAMGDWMSRRLGNDPIMWLDEVFANRTLRPRGNLRNFGTFVPELARRLGCTTIAYRTIASQMTWAARRDVGDNAAIFPRKEAVPDRRDFVIITTREEQ